MFPTSILANGIVLSSMQWFVHLLKKSSHLLTAKAVSVSSVDGYYRRKNDFRGFPLVTKIANGLSRVILISYGLPNGNILFRGVLLADAPVLW